MLTVYSTNAGTSRLWCQAFQRGCPGSRLQVLGDIRDGDLAMLGDPKLEPGLFAAQRRGQTWYYGDHAFFGRMTYYRCARNAFQHDGLSGTDDPKRFRGFHIPVLDWRQRGDHVLLCPNSPRFLAAHGHATWLEDVTAELKKHTDREIRSRWKSDKDRPLQEDLKNCWAVVTFTSNAAVEAILAGVPAISTRQCAALSMGSGDLSTIENPRMPEGREAWAARLANNQWTLQEMSRGQLWEALGQ